MNDPKHLGTQIAEHRKRKNLTQASIGRQGTISAIEKGGNVNLYTWLDTLDAIGLEVQLVPRTTAKPSAVASQEAAYTSNSSRQTLQPRRSGLKLKKAVTATAVPTHVSLQVLEGKIKRARKNSSEEPSRLLAARQIKD